jgi:RNA polymerase sigma-70 factor (ECF subfamily)
LGEVRARESLPDTEITAAVQVLPGEFRMAVYHADAEGFPYPELAQKMDMPLTSRPHRGRRQLRRLLAEVVRERGVTRGHPATAPPAVGLTPVTTHPNVRDRSGNARSTGSM